MPKPLKPLTIHLYDGNDKITKTFSRQRIPWGVLKRAIRMAETLDEENITAEDLDNIAGLVSDAFGGDVTIEELDKYGDISEMMTVIQGIIERATVTVPNPQVR